MAQVAPKAEYKGQISVTVGMKITRPTGGIPVTGDLIKTSDPDDPRLANLRQAQECVVMVTEIATGTMIANYHTKLHQAKVDLKNMAEGKWTRYPKVTKRDHLLAPTLSGGGSK